MESDSRDYDVQNAAINHRNDSQKGRYPIAAVEIVGYVLARLDAGGSFRFAELFDPRLKSRAGSFALQDAARNR